MNYRILITSEEQQQEDTPIMGERLVPILDMAGNPVLDARGEQVLQLATCPLLDEKGEVQKEPGDAIVMVRASLLGTNFAGYGDTPLRALTELMGWCWQMAGLSDLKEELLQHAKRLESAPDQVRKDIADLETAWSNAKEWKETPVLDGFEVRIL